MMATLDNTSTGFDQHHSKYSISGDLTYYRTGWLGAHEFQTGFLLQPRNRINIFQFNVNFAGGYSSRTSCCETRRIPRRGSWRSTGSPRMRRASCTDRRLTRDLGVYLQDAWRPTERLTINLGLRVDFIKRSDQVFDVQTMKKTEIGPRLGLNYAVTADRRNIVRASWVRVHFAPTGELVGRQHQESGPGTSTIST